jgi:anti-sigma factor RsiW
MPSASQYQAAAERCRELAETTRDPEQAATWRKLAEEYDKLIAAIDNEQMKQRRKKQPHE